MSPTLKERFKMAGLAHEIAWVEEFLTEQVENNNTDKITIKTLEAEISKRRLKEGEPLAYILGSWPFADLNIAVGPGVLIPRPETEELCYLVLDKIKKHSDLRKKKDLRIVDFGAGSGCLGLGILNLLIGEAMGLKAKLFLVEKSPDALIYLNKNVKTFLKSQTLFGGSVEVSSGDWNNFDQGVDVFLSNPPYVSQNEFDSCDPSVKKFEPSTALMPNDLGDFPDASGPYKSFRKIIKSSGAQIYAMEIGYQQGEVLRRDYDEAGLSPTIQKDMAGKDRFLVGEI